MCKGLIPDPLQINRIFFPKTFRSFSLSLFMKICLGVDLFYFIKLEACVYFSVGSSDLLVQNVSCIFFLW